MKISKATANAALVQAITGIAGSGYYTDLGGRVFTRLLTPLDDAVEMPFAIVPLVGENESLEYEGRTITSTWTMRVHFFCRDNHDTDALNTTTSTACGRWRDDLVKAIETNAALLATVKAVVVANVVTFSGGDDIGYGEVVADVQLKQIFAVTDLGPNA